MRDSWWFFNHLVVWLHAAHIWRYLLDMPEGGIHGVMDHRLGEGGSSTWWKIYNKSFLFILWKISKWLSNTEKMCKPDRLTKMHSLSPCYVGTKMCNKSCGFLQLYINFCTRPWSVVCSCGTFVVAKFHIGFHFSFVSTSEPAHNTALSHQLLAKKRWHPEKFQYWIQEI